MRRDTLPKEIVEALKDSVLWHPRVGVAECEVSDGLLHGYDLTYIINSEPLQVLILRHCHDHPAAGYSGLVATYEIIPRDYSLSGMGKTVVRNITNCGICKRRKSARHALFGFLQPLHVPQRRWKNVLCDIIIGLQEYSRKNSIMVTVDRLIKIAHLAPAKTDSDPNLKEGPDTKQTGRLYLNYVFKLHGAWDLLASGRGGLFIFKLEKTIMSFLKIKHHDSTAHPETHDQAEWINAVFD